LFQNLNGTGINTPVGNVTLPSIIYMKATASISLSTLASAFVAGAEDSFCGDAGCSVSDNGKTKTVPGLRGVSSTRFFEADGEYYLAVAQSVCEHSMTRAECIGEQGATNVHAQPQSAILQWDKVAGRFQEMRSITDAENNRLYGSDVPLEQRRQHEFAMRIDAGRVYGWEHVVIDSVHYLVAASGTHGTLVYRWEFLSLEGLAGGTSVATDRTDTRVFVASEHDMSLVTLGRGMVYDGLGMRTGACTGTERCLHFRAVSKNAPYDSAGAAPRGSPSQFAEGLAGARKVKVQCPVPHQMSYNFSSCPTKYQLNVSSLGQNPSTGHPWDDTVFYISNGTRVNVSCNDSSLIGPMAYTGSHDIFWMPPEMENPTKQDYVNGLCHVVVFGGPRRDEALCRPHSGRHAQLLPATARRSAPACQDVSFTVTLVSVDNPALIEIAPVISSAGTLYFTAAPRQIGNAKFRVDMVDSGQVFEIGSTTLGDNRAAPRFFTLQVLAINNAPSFLAHDVFCNQDTGMQKLIFASEVRAGGEHESQQHLAWRYQVINVYQPFLIGPFFEVTEMDGSLYGVVRFQIKPHVSAHINFKVELVDDGPQLASRGDAALSYHQNFTLTVRKVNQAPYFLFPEDGISVVASLPSVIRTGEKTLYRRPKWAFNLSAGTPLEDLEQKVSFVLDSVDAVSSRWPGDGIVSDFVLWPNGTLDFTLAPDRAGTFVVNVMASDNGGTAYGGLDWNIVSFPLNIDPPQDEAGNAVSPVPVLQGPRQLNVPEAKDEIRQVFPNYLADVDLGVLAPKDRGKLFVFRVDNSNPFLFLDGPHMSYPDGTITFMLRPYSNGVAHLSVYLVQPGANSSRPDETFPLDITVLPVNDAPSFELLTSMGTLQDAGPSVIPGFAYNLVAGPPDEAWQLIYFDPSFDTDSPNLFASPPDVDLFGSLRFVSAPGQHGYAHIRVVATDDGGVDFDGRAMSHVVESSLKVFPLPRVLDVVPAVLTATGGTRVTVVGLYFGSPYSRGYSEPSGGYGLLDVLIGGRPCTNLTVSSDTEILCTAPALVGKQGVVVVIREPGLERSGRMARTVTFNAVYFGGIFQHQVARGVLGTGPSLNRSVPFVPFTAPGVVLAPPTSWAGVPVSGKFVFDLYFFTCL